jgi:hypothetical protein
MGVRVMPMLSAAAAARIAWNADSFFSSCASSMWRRRSR